jgi:hypothetical protein
MAVTGSLPTVSDQTVTLAAQSSNKHKGIALLYLTLLEAQMQQNKKMSIL